MKFSAISRFLPNAHRGILALGLGAIMCLFLLSGCEKDNGCDASGEGEEAKIQAFITANGITATKHPRGFYYQIIAPGSTNKPVLASLVYCTYRGTLLDGTQFDAQTNPGNTGFRLNGTILGWQLGVPLIGKGGTIKLILPSSFGYGCSGSGSTIPPGAPLYFEIGLVDFFN